MKHESCDTLPLSALIDCLVDGNLSGMGGASDDENAALWATCYEEYCLLVNRQDASYSMLLAMEIEQIRYRYISIDRGIELLHMIRDNEIVDMLRKEGFRYPFNDKDRPSYFKDLAAARKKADRMLFDIRDREAMLKKISGEDRSVKITRQKFNDDIAVLSKSMGFKINKNETTAAEYAAYICMHIAMFNSKKDIKNGRGTDNRPN